MGPFSAPIRLSGVASRGTQDMAIRPTPSAGLGPSFRTPGSSAVEGDAVPLPDLETPEDVREGAQPPGGAPGRSGPAGPPDLLPRESPPRRAAGHPGAGRQLTEAFNFPPTNHLALEGFQSRTFLQGLNQRSSFAKPAQNVSKSRSAFRWIEASRTLALAAKPLGDRSVRFSRRRLPPPAGVLPILCSRFKCS